MRMAAVMTQSVCSRTDAIRTHLLRIEKALWNLAKRKDPKQKHRIDVPDLIHLVEPVGFARPSPT